MNVNFYSHDFLRNCFKLSIIIPFCFANPESYSFSSYCFPGKGDLRGIKLSSLTLKETNFLMFSLVIAFD